MLDLAVIIPCYNESTAISDVLTSISRIIFNDFRNQSCEIFVYDNNSTDNTAEVVKSFKGSVTLCHAYRQGKGYAVRQAFQEINAHCYCMIDGDDTYSPERLRAMYDLIISKQADMVIGDRLSTSYFTENKRSFHNFGNRIVRKTINSLFKVKYNDILSGFRTFSYAFVKTFPITSGGFTLETEMSIHAARYNIVVKDIPVDYKDRKEGSESKLQTIPDGMRVVFKIISMTRLYKPLLFYGLISMIFIIPGIGFMIPAMDDYITTGMAERFPVLIVCCLSMFIGIFSGFIGILQHDNVQKQKQDFEQRYIDKITYLAENHFR